MAILYIHGVNDALGGVLLLNIEYKLACGKGCKLSDKDTLGSDLYTKLE